MKNEDWPFFAVFQKGLLRASALAWRQYPVVGGSDNSTIDGFLTSWIGFLDDLADRGLMKVKASFPKREKERVWVGISLNVAAETVRWSEVSVQRIAALLVLWWYFYSTKKTKVGSFLKKVMLAKSNEVFPKARELALAAGKGLRSVVVKSDEELDEEEIAKRVERRLRDLIVLALNKAATPDDGSEEDEEDEGGVAESLTKAEGATNAGPNETSAS
jgi:hypothetical protein